MLKSLKGTDGVRYVIYDPIEDCYFVVVVSYNGEGSILALHHGRVDDLDGLLSGYADQMNVASGIENRLD